MINKIILISCMLVFGLCACQSSQLISNVEINDISSLEVYKYILPIEAKMKETKDVNEIKKRIDDINSLKILGKGSKAPEISGGNVLIFVFKINENDDLVVVCTENRIKISNGTDRYIEENALHASFEDLSSEAVDIEETNIPKL